LLRRWCSISISVLDASGYKSVDAPCSKALTVVTHRYTQGSLLVRDCGATSDSIQLPHFILQILSQFFHIQPGVADRYPVKQCSCAEQLSDSVLVMPQWADSVSHNVYCSDTREMPGTALADIRESLALQACARRFVFNSAFPLAPCLFPIYILLCPLGQYPIAFRLRPIVLSQAVLRGVRASLRPLGAEG
jgi:hypothetical protein